MKLKTIAAAVLFSLLSAPAFAHLDPGEHGSFMAGASHPLFGVDHILAMVSVGLWAALLGGRAIGLVPAAFVATMLAGFLAAMTNVQLPFVEPVILASVVVVGLVTTVALRVPTPVAMALVGFFAFFHGHAHGGELGEAAALSFAIGFAVSTAILHGAGIVLGHVLGRSAGAKAGDVATRLAGGVTALAGLWLAFGA